MLAACTLPIFRIILIMRLARRLPVLRLTSVPLALKRAVSLFFHPVFSISFRVIRLLIHLILPLVPATVPSPVVATSTCRHQLLPPPPQQLFLLPILLRPLSRPVRSRAVMLSASVVAAASPAPPQPPKTPQPWLVPYPIAPTLFSLLMALALIAAVLRPEQTSP